METSGSEQLVMINDPNLPNTSFSLLNTESVNHETIFLAVVYF